MNGLPRPPGPPRPPPGGARPPSANIPLNQIAAPTHSYNLGERPVNTGGFGSPVSVASSDDIVSKVQTIERISALEKRNKWLCILVILCLVLTIVSLGAAFFAIVSRPATTTNNNSGGSTTPVSTGSGGTGAAASAFTPTQLTELDTRIQNITSGQPGRDGKNGTCIGVYGLNETHIVGGYYAWTFRSSQSNMYPYADVHAKVGDVIVFKGPHNSPTSIWETVVQFFDKTAFDNCDFSLRNVTSRIIAGGADLRLAGGFRFTLQPQHADKTLYFASDRMWQNPRRYCDRGIKVKVVVSKRLELPIRFTDSEAADTATVLQLRNTMSKMGRLAILTQLQLEQRIRSEGHSGLTDVRGYGQGIREYNDGGFSRGAIASIHNHADLLRTVGIGEIQGVLNGVEFQTRHNDYALRMPHRTSKIYGHTEEIPFPDVPPAVLSKTTVAEQVTEMQAWFKAFKDQDWSTRDYRNYFKPILCYLEGTWIKVTEDLTDPFLSERHTLDAKTWNELHNKMRFLSNNGRKNLAENIAFLPNAVRSMLNDTWPVFGNWEYRILCIPLKDDLPLQRLRVAGDLQTQLRASPINRAELATSRAARFELNTRTSGSNPLHPTLRNDGTQNPISWNDGPRSWDYLDYLMEQIPGKDNYPANLTDSLAGGTSPAHHFYNNEFGRLNAGYYSRYYSVVENDAMGTQKHRRGYHDAYLFAARTSQARVSEVEYTEDFNVDPQCRGSSCATYEVKESAKWSYAVPMEIIYLTPLTKWNPYNLTQHTDLSKVTANSRTGSCCDPVNGVAPCVAAQKAYDGFHGRKAFFTPASFFGSGSEGGGGDTVSGADSCVLDPKDPTKVLRARASGHWIVFPSIGGGVGEIRQRYPIMPIHEMGSTSYREVKALQELTLASNYDTINTGYFGDTRDERFGFTIELVGGGHQHFVRISPGSLNSWKINGVYDTTGTAVLTANSDIRNGHEHTVELTRTLVNGVWRYQIKGCKLVGATGAFNPNTCTDGHGSAVRST